MSRLLFLFSHFSICCSSYASLLITPRGEIMLDIPLKPRRMCGGEQNQSRLIRFSGHPKLILPPIGFGIHARWGGKMALQTRFIAPYFEGGFFFLSRFLFYLPEHPHLRKPREALCDIAFFPPFVLLSNFRLLCVSYLEWEGEQKLTNVYHFWRERISQPCKWSLLP